MNGLTAYIFGTTQSTRCKSVFSDFTFGPSVYAGIRVFKRSETGVETEITTGSPVAVVQRTTTGSGYHSNTWSCPETALSPTDSIVVRVYLSIDEITWSLGAVFTTERLGASKLNTSTWTVVYYLGLLYDSETRMYQGAFIFGASTCNSRVEGFSWEPALIEYIRAQNYPRLFIQEPVNARILLSRFSYGTTTLVNNVFPKLYIRRGRAQILLSKYS